MQLKSILYTGASSGLGYSLTLEILSRGDAVIATARDVAKLDFLKRNGAHIMQLDVTDDFAVIRRKAKEAIEVYGRVDVLGKKRSSFSRTNYKPNESKSITQGMVCLVPWKRSGKCLMSKLNASFEMKTYFITYSAQKDTWLNIRPMCLG